VACHSRTLKNILTMLGLIALLSSMSGCDTLQSEGLPVAPGHLVMEKVMIPAHFKNKEGVYTANLDAIIVRPDDDQIHPLVLINHGFDPFNHKLRYIDDFQRQTMEFARRGWVAVAFSRRGYGHSEGEFVENVKKDCDVPAFITAGVVPTADMREVRSFMAGKSYVDASRMIAVGHSGGGYDMIALTAKPLPGLLAAIDFAGEVRTAKPDLESCYNETLMKAVAHFGATSRTPMLWVYAGNDIESPVEVGRRMYKAFTDAGGNAELIDNVWFPGDGHNLFFHPEGIPIWAPYVDAFLEKQGLKLMDGLIPVSNMRIVTQGDKQ